MQLKQSEVLQEGLYRSSLDSTSSEDQLSLKCRCGSDSAKLLTDEKGNGEHTAESFKDFKLHTLADSDTTQGSPCGHSKKSEIEEIPLAEDKELLEHIAKTQGTPTYCVDHYMIRYNCSRFKTYLPNVNVFYSIKTNPSLSVMKTVFQQGCGFDFASISEFRQILTIIKDLPDDQQRSFIKNKVIYAHPVKPPTSLTQLDKYGVLATYDNVYELPKIKKYAPHTRLILRIAAHNPTSVYNLSVKFGCDPSEAMGLLEAAVKMGLAVEGVSFHIGSQSRSPIAYDMALKATLKIFHEAEAKGIHLSKVDIGGGFPVCYGEKVCTLQDCANVIQPNIAQFPAGTQFFAEPGRVIIGDAVTLLVGVIGKDLKDGKQCLYLDDGLYGVLTCTINDIRRPIYALKSEGELKPTVLFGPTADSRDKVCDDVQYPEMEPGDIFYVPKMGAYDTGLMCWYNGMGEYKVYDHSS